MMILHLWYTISLHSLVPRLPFENRKKGKSLWGEVFSLPMAAFLYLLPEILLACGADLALSRPAKTSPLKNGESLVSFPVQVTFRVGVYTSCG